MVNDKELDMIENEIVDKLSEFGYEFFDDDYAVVLDCHI